MLERAKKKKKKKLIKLAVVVHICNLSTQEMKTGRVSVHSWLEVHSKTLSPPQKNTIQIIPRYVAAMKVWGADMLVWDWSDGYESCWREKVKEEQQSQKFFTKTTLRIGWPPRSRCRRWRTAILKKVCSSGSRHLIINPSTQQAVAGKYLSSRPVLSSEWVPRESRIHRWTLSQKTNTKKEQA